MEIHLDPRSEQLVEQQLRAGRFNSPEEVVARALETFAGGEPAAEENEPRRAVRDMLEFADRHHFTLGEDLTVQDLIHEAHKY